MALERFEPKTINHQILQGLVEMMNKGRLAQIAPLVNCQRPVLELALGQLVKSEHLTYNTLSGLYTVTDEALRIHDIKPAGIEELEGSTVGKIDGKKCTFCEKTKPTAEFYADQGRCKICFNGVQKVGKLRREGKPIPADLQHFASATSATFGSTKAPTPKAKPVAVSKAPPAPPSDGPFRIVPETVTECRVIGSGEDAEAMITQAGRVHLYRLKELQQLRDWASGVLKREMAA